MKTLILLFTLLFVGCSNSQNQINVEKFNKITFINKTKNDIKNVRVSSLKTFKFMSCSFIPQGQFCTYSFPGRLVKNNMLEISWDERDKSFVKYSKINDIPESSYPLNIKIDVLENNIIEIIGI